MLSGLAVTAAITRYWKISLHTGVAAGTATVVTLTFGPVLLATAGLVVAVGWSRVHVRDHTPRQAITGAMLGAVVAAVVFLTLR